MDQNNDISCVRYAVFRMINGKLHIMSGRPAYPDWIPVEDMSSHNGMRFYKSRRVAENCIDDCRIKPKMSADDDGCYVGEVEITYHFY